MVRILPLLMLLFVCSTVAYAQLPPPCPSNQEPPADICELTCIYCNFNGIMSTTTGYTGQTPPGFCGSIENEQWLGFIAGAAAATFTATPSNCQIGNGIQIALYTDCNSNPVACNGGATGGGMTPVSITASLVPGVNYFLLVDGFAGDQCDFMINVVPPIAVQAPNVGPTGPISGPLVVCPGATVTYSVPTVTGAGAYTWSVPPGSTINGQGSPLQLAAPDGNTVDVTFGATGGQICVFPENSCDQGTQRCINVIVQPIAPTVIPPALVCFEDTPYELPWGQAVFGSGTYQTTLQSYLGCDSIVRQTVNVKPQIVVNRPLTALCEGECVMVLDEEFCQGGNYTIVGESFQGCDSTINFTILVLDPIAEILGGDTISCSQTTVTLNSTLSSGTTKIWRRLPANNVVGTGNSVTVTQAGTYTLTVTATGGGKICVEADTITIPADTLPPVANAVGGVIGCASTTTQISANSPAPVSSYAWTGPNGFNSALQTPTVGAAGNYVVTITSSGNGCTNIATAVVTGDTVTPIAGATGGTLTCRDTTVTLNGTSSASNSTYNWSGPAGFTSMLQNPVVSNPGTYTLVVTNSINGCADTTTTLVNLNDTPPGATATPGGVISCTTPSITVNGSSPASNPIYSWTGPGGFSSSQQNPLVNTAGPYVLTVEGTNGCTSTATANVTGNTIPPDATAAGTTLSCSIPSASITGNSATPGATFSWTGPGGFSSNQQNPTVNVVGLYVLTVTGPNACTQTANALVDGDFAVPDISATGGVITCGSSTTTISGTSNTPGATFLWNGPGGFTSNQPAPTVNQTGTYTLTVRGPNGCTSTSTAQVVPDQNVPNASANGGTLSCAITSITLDGNSNTPGVTLSWTGPGGFSSTQQDPVVTVPGVYTLTVEDPSNGCTAQADATVNLDDAEPGASASSGTLTCTDPAIPVVGSSPTSNVTWAWFSPNGFSSTEQSPVVTQGGPYTLTVTGPNGCTSTASTTVLVDQTNPATTLSTNTLTCSITSVTISSTVTLPVTYVWNGPGGFTSTDANPVVTLPGNYTVVVTAANGCTDTDFIDVPQDIAPPDIATNGNTISCNSPQVPLTGSSATPGALFSWTGPGGFTSTQPSPVVDMDGTYILTVTGPNGCTSTSNALVDTDVEAPQLSGVVNDILTCALTNVTIFADISSPASPVQNIQWAGPGGFSSTQEDPSVTDPGTYILTVTSANGCSSELSLDVSQDINPPNATATGATLTCAITSITLDGGTPTTGSTFAWTGPGGFTSTLEDPTVSVDGVYDLVVTGPNGCTSTAAAVADLDVAEPGVTTQSSNNLDCAFTSTTLTATTAAQSPLYDWSGPGGFDGNTATVSTMMPGDYTVVVTGVNGCTSTETLTILQDINPPGASASGDTTDCISGTAQLAGNSPTGSVQWLWNGPGQFTSTQQNPTATVPGNYQLTVTGPNGCTSTATASVIENDDSPVVSLNGAGTITCAVPTLTLTGTISTPGATGVWTDPNSMVIGTGASVDATIPGVYTYTVTALNGCISAPTLTILQDIENPQDVVATGGLLNCTFPTISLSGSTSTTGVTYAWTGPGGFSSTEQNPVVNTPGEYTLLVTNTVNGCTSSDTAVVVQDPTIPDILVKTDTLTCSVTSVVLEATSNTPSVTYLWSGPGGFTSTEEDPSINVPGGYTVVVTALSGCTSTFAIEVQQNITPPGVTAQGDTLTCTLPTGTITSTSPTPNVTYAWTGPGGFTSTSQNPTVTLTGAYTVVVTAPNGCTSAASVEVVPDASIPQVSATGGTVTCDVTSIQLTATSNQPNVTWLWSGPAGFTSTLQNPTATAPGNYTVVATAVNGCTNSTGTTILADNQGPEVQTTTPDELNCTTTQVTLNAFVQAPGIYSYAWTTTDGNILSGDNSATPTVGQGGIYTVVVTDENNGCTTEADVEVLVDPATPSDANLTVRDVSCFGDTDGALIINSIVGGTPPFLYSFDNGPFVANPLYSGLAPGTYDLVVQDANGCEYLTSIDILEPEELFVELGPDTIIVYGDSLLLSLDDIVNFPDRIETVRVNPASLVVDSTFRPLASFRYTVTVIDSNGCTATDTRLVVVQKPRNVYIPNVFNPESNEGNNLFYIFGDEKVVNIRAFQVFDRWGGIVHEYFDFLPNDAASGWDGTIRGEKGNPGVFTYYAEIEFLDGEVILYKGDVTLSRN